MRSRTTVLAVVIALLTLSLYGEPARKRALLIGINDYTASRLKTDASEPSLDRDWANLGGTINDVDLMRELIESTYGFAAADITVLKDQQATRAAIVAAMRRLIAAVKKGDIVFVYYSGHGSQVRNSLSAERDKLDESLVPADSRHGADDIRDKELRNWFNQILDRGAQLTVVLDSCHSGSGARGLDGGLRSRVLKPNVQDARDPSTGPRPEDRGALILSAAQDFDPAYETRANGRIHGAFTWALACALADSESGEPVSDTFLRAQARLHVDRPGQNPVIAGTPAVRLRPFLRERIDRRNRRPVIAIERITPNGTYIVQGGWTNGVTVGSELRLAGSNDVRLEVRSLLGISRAEARLVGGQPRARPRLEPGALLEIAAWAPPPSRPLRVWIPRAEADAIPFAQQLRSGASQRGIRWVDDPTETSPSHLVRWRNGAWELVVDGRASRTVKPLDTITSGASLFVQLPVPPKLTEAIGEIEGLELTSGPDSADYIFAGRLTSNGVEYAFVRPRASTSDRGRAPLPPRTAWHSESAAFAFRDALLRLQRVHGWLDLRSPNGAESYYTLGIRRADDRVLVEDGVLLGERPHHLVLRAKPGHNGVYARYIYAFVIDSAGSSVLLFPRANSGSVENRLPQTAQAAKPMRNAPAEIPLDPAEPFTIAAPYGADTYFLLSTDEPLTALASLEWAGVRGGRDRSPASPKTPLERLLARTLTGTRGNPGDEPIRTRPNWSLERVTFHSIAPRRTSR